MLSAIALMSVIGTEAVAQLASGVDGINFCD